MKFLINRSDAIGDLILTTPIAEAIKEKFPQAEITFLISKKCEDIAKNCPFIDRYHIFSKSNFLADILDLWRFIRHEHFTHYLHLGGRQWPNLLAFLACIPFRGGLRSKWQSFVFLNKAIRQKRSLVEMHEIDYNLQTLLPLGISQNSSLSFRPKLVLPELTRTQDYLHFVSELPANLRDFKRLIFIHPGMTGHTLNWPEANYAQFMFKLYQQYGDELLFVLSHTPSDFKYISLVKEALSHHPEVQGRVYEFNGVIKGLQHYMHILSHASLFIGPSTGTTHIANILGVKAIGIYSPIKVQSAKRWGPAMRLENLCRVLVPDVVCGERFNCAGEECPYFPCMGIISVDLATQCAKELLEGENS